MNGYMGYAFLPPTLARSTVVMTIIGVTNSFFFSVISIQKCRKILKDKRLKITKFPDHTHFRANPAHI